ncbi:MAG: hypothetical protein E7511_03035 [Ruminococcus sp.]|nr:hypothetical protein [Ruminococcus sp.]
MMNLLYEPLPDCIQAGGRLIPVLTDFREWIRFADMIADPELSDTEKLCLMREWLDEPECITEEIVNALYAFYRADALEPDPLHEDEKNEVDGEKQQPLPSAPVFSWSVDARFLLGDFRRYYGIDLLETGYLHWWAFKALFAALPDESQCQKRIAYRSVNLSDIKDNKERERIRRIQQRIALPFEYDDEMIGEMLGGMM